LILTLFFYSFLVFAYPELRLEGNVFSDVGSNHYNAHQSMESYWSQYRKGGDLEGITPTIDTYNEVQSISQ
jgi:hypothetical protein